MSESKELRRIIGAMTERPWNEYTVDVAVEHYVNAVGAVTLANHADALVALVEAVERLAAASDVSEFAVYKYKLFSALDDIHAIKEQP